MDGKRRLIQLFSGAFFLFGGVFLLMSMIGPLFLGNYLKYGNLAYSSLDLTWILLLLTVVFILFLLSMHRLLCACHGKTVYRLRFLLVAVIGGYELFLLIVFSGIQPPEIDGGHVFMKAYHLLEANRNNADTIYFQIYPNNIPLLLIRYGLYRIFPLQSVDAFLFLDHLLCMAVLNCAILFSAKIVKIIFGMRMSVFFLVLIATCFPLFFYSLYFYSDTLMIMMPPLLIYLWMRYEQGNKPYGLLFCLLLAAGCVIRQNLILFLPALIIYLLLQKRIKHVLMFTVVTLGALLIMQNSAIQLAEGIHLKSNDHAKMPTTHWIMLGLSEQGRYNYNDFQRTFTKQTQEEKRKATTDEIKKRLHEKSIGTLISLWFVKAFRVYADGSMGYYWYLGNTSTHSLMYDYLIGGQRALFLLIIQAFHCANLFFLLCSALRAYRKKHIDTGLLLQMMLFGNFVFYIFVWEAEPRYALLFLFPFLIMNCYGVSKVQLWLGEKRQMNRSLWSITGQHTAHLLVILLLAVTVFHFRVITQESDVQYRYAVNQNQRKGSLQARVSLDHYVSQTFYADRSFDHISLGMSRSKGDGIYQVTLRSRSGDEEQTKQFTKHGLKKGTLSNFNFVRPFRGKKKYVLTVSMIGNQQHSYLDLAIHGKGLFEQRDLYRGGSLMFNGRILEGRDLQFRAYMRDTRPYLSTTSYFVFVSVLLLMIILFTDVYRDPVGVHSRIPPDPA